MAKLTYMAIASLDGYIEDTNGSFSWAQPDEEVHAFVNGIEATVGIHLYGRRMYETMVYWERLPDQAEQPPYAQEYASIWRAAEKIVYSKTLQVPTSAKTRIERAFDPEAVLQLKETATSDLSIGGPQLAASAIAAELVDEYHLFLVPVAVGAGKPAFPEAILVNLELLDERRFGNGTVYVRYRSA